MDIFIYYEIDYSDKTIEIDGPHEAGSFAEMEKALGMLDDGFMQESRKDNGGQYEIGSFDDDGWGEAFLAQLPDFLKGPKYRVIDGDGWLVAYKEMIF